MNMVLTLALTHRISRNCRSLFSRNGRKTTLTFDTKAKMLSTQRLSYADFPGSVDGDNSQSPLVILHGLFGAKTNWQSLAKRLSTNLKTRVLVVEARNHGDSPHDRNMNYLVMAQDLVTFIENLNLKRVNLLGHSMGGKTAMVVALQQPHLLNSLIVEDVSPMLTSSAADFQGYIRALQTIQLCLHGNNLAQLRRNTMQQLATVIPNIGTRSFLLQNLVIDEGKKDYVRWKCNLENIYQNLDSLCDWPEHQLANKQFTNPTHFIGGANSPYLRNGSFLNKERIRSYFPHVTFDIIPDAGHWVHSEQPKMFLSSVTKFLSSLHSHL